MFYNKNKKSLNDESEQVSIQVVLMTNYTKGASVCVQHGFNFIVIYSGGEKTKKNIQVDRYLPRK